MGGGEGVVAVVHEGHVRGGGRLGGGGGGNVGLDVVPAVAQGGQAVDPSPPLPHNGVGRGDAERGWAMSGSQ